MSRTWMVGIVGAALVLLAACGRSAPEDQPPPAAKPGGPPSNWEVPLHGSRIVASAKQAARHVHFSVREPHFASRPALIQVDDPAQVPVDDRTVAFVYHLPAAGTVVVEERSAHLTLAELRQRADAPGVPADAFQMVPVRATEGLLVSGSGISGLLWTEGGVLFDITGPQRQPVTGAGAGRARLSWHRSWHRFDNNLSACRCPQTPAHSTSRTPCTTQCCWSGSRRFARLKITLATNMGLTAMAESCGVPYDVLAWTAEWYVRPETLEAANTAVVNYHHRLPLTRAFGPGTLSSSDGQRFPTKGRSITARALSRYFARGQGISAYTHVSDQHSTFDTKVIVAAAPESHYVLDGILGNDTDLPITEHATDTHGATLANFALFDLVGKQLSPRIRDLGKITLYRTGPRAAFTSRYPHAGRLLTRRLNAELLTACWDDLLRVAASVKYGHATAALVVGKLCSSKRQQNALTAAIKEYGALRRTIFVSVTWNLTVGMIISPLYDHELRRCVGQDGGVGEEVAGTDSARASSRVAAGVDRSRPGSPDDRCLRPRAGRVPGDVRPGGRRSARREPGARRRLCA